MTLTELAKEAVENYAKNGEIISPPSDLPADFINRRAGTFVTIEKSGDLQGLPSNQTRSILRGCIGTYLPTRKDIAEEVIHNAIAAATKDYRFDPILEKELPQLSYAVYILSRPEPVKDINKLNPKKYGIIVKTAPIISPGKTDVVFNGHSPCKSGLLLPGLRRINTVKKQIFIACQKAGIDPTLEKVLIYRFVVEKYSDN